MKKLLFALSLVFSISILIMSCQEAPAAPKTVNLAIEGMTCEIGCAKRIEKKLAEIDGVITDKVNFDEKSAVIEFDASKINENDLISTIEGLGEYTAQVK